MKYENLKRGYGNLFRRASIKPEHRAELDMWTSKILANRTRYETIAATVGCPWYLVAVIHVRESSCDFSRHFHNGDPLTARTVHRPAGRPITGEPPFTFEESAADAMMLKGFADVPSWEIERVLYELERYNGTGYFRHGVNSPYLWSFTDLYRQGKYTSDGDFDADHVDEQPGSVAIIKVLIEKGIIAMDDTMQQIIDKISSLATVVPVLAETASGPGAWLAVKAVAQVLNLPAKDTAGIDAKLDNLDASGLIERFGSAEKLLKVMLAAETPAPAPVPVEPAAGPLDNLLGGEALKGYKTFIGGAIFLAAIVAEALAPGVPSSMIVIAKWFGGVLAGAGVVAKIERLWLDFRGSFLPAK